MKAPPDALMILVLVMIGGVEIAALIAGQPLAEDGKCVVLIALVALGAYLAHIRQLRKYGVLAGDEYVSIPEDSEPGDEDDA